MDRLRSRRGRFWVALALLIIYGALSAFMYFTLWPDAPVKTSTGVIFVSVTADSDASTIRVHGDFSAALTSEAGRPGGMEITVFSEDGRSTLRSVRLTLCGDVSQASLVDEFGRALTDSDLSSSTVAVDGFELSQCRQVERRPGPEEDPLQGMQFSGELASGWGVQAGDRVLYVLPGLRWMPGDANGRFDGQVALVNTPTDLYDVIASPAVSASPLIWDFAAKSGAPLDYRVSGALRNQSNQVIRNSVMLGVFLGLASGSFIWLLEIWLSPRGRFNDVGDQDHGTTTGHGPIQARGTEQP